MLNLLYGFCHRGVREVGPRVADHCVTLGRFSITYIYVYKWLIYYLVINLRFTHFNHLHIFDYIPDQSDCFSESVIKKLSFVHTWKGKEDHKLL